MAGAVVTGSLTAFAGQTNNYWVGKSYVCTWWNSYQSRWDGVIPNDESGGLSDHGDKWICKDVGGTEDYVSETAGRGTSRISIYWDDAGKKLHVIDWHKTTTQYDLWTYNSGTDTYSSSVTDETVTGMAFASSNDSGGMIVVPNGDVWVALQHADGLILNRRTGGSWNGSVVNLDSGLGVGCATMSWFANAGTNYVFVFGGEDDVATDAEFNSYYIDEDAAAPFTAGNWTEDTISSMDGEADNHVCCVKDNSENIYIVVKTGGTSTGDTLIGLFKRTVGGTYTSHEVRANNADDEKDASRPVVAFDATNNRVFVAYNRQNGSATDQQQYYVAADASDLDTWDSETDLFSSSGLNFQDNRAPQSDFGCTNTSGMLFVSSQDTNYRDDNDEDVWFRKLTIAAATTVFPPLLGKIIRPASRRSF